MGDLDDVEAVVQDCPGSTAADLRAALVARGRSSITTADVLRALTGHPRRFRADDGAPARWWPLGTHGRSATATPRRDGAGPGTPSSDRAAPWRGPALYAWQREALLAWRAQHERGVVEAVTGTGKTMVGVAAAAEELAKGGQVAVLVPTRDLLHQWGAVLRETLPPGAQTGLVGDGCHDHLGHADVVVAVVNSARDGRLRPRRPGGLVIADECHRYASAANLAALAHWFPRRLGLSATYARADDAHLRALDPYFGGICYRIGYERALRDGVIAPFTLGLCGVRFSDAEYADYERLGTEMAAARARLLRSAVVAAEPVGAFLADVARLARGTSDLAPAALAYVAAMAERRRMLAETPAKADALATLTPLIARATRALVFTHTIAGAERAARCLQAAGIRAAALHSARCRDARRDLLQRFRQGDLAALAAPTVLDEGVDVPAADVAVVLAASRSRRQMVQRMGRVLRPKPDGRSAQFIVVYVERTNEDPASGAHDGFLDEVGPVATSVRHVPEGTAWAAAPAAQPSALRRIAGRGAFPTQQ